MQPITNQNISIPNQSISNPPNQQLLSQLIKLKFEYSPFLKNLTLKQWVILQLIERLNPKCDENYLKLIAELAKENPDFPLCKTLFQSSMRDPQLADQRMILVQLDLVLTLQKNSLNTCFGDIFNDQISSNPTENNQKIEELLKSALYKVQSILVFQLNKSNQIKAEYDKLFHEFVEMREDNGQSKKNQPINQKRGETAKDRKFLETNKETLRSLTDNLNLLKNTLDSNKNASLTMTMNRLKYYPQLVAGHYANRKKALDTFNESDKKEMNSPYLEKVEDQIAQIIRLIKQFKLKPEEKEKLIARANEIRGKASLESEPIVHKGLMCSSMLKLLIKTLKEFDKRPPVSEIEKNFSELFKALKVSAHHEGINKNFTSYTNRLQVESETSNGNQVVELEKQVERDTALAGELCVTTAALVQNILGKRVSLTPETEEDKLAIFSQWEEPVNHTEKVHEDVPDVYVEEEIDETEETAKQNIAPAVKIAPEQQVSYLCEMMINHIPATQIRMKELRGHIYLATQGMEMLLNAMKQQDWSKLGTIYPMLLIDWHSMMESHLNGNKESHSLIARSVVCKLNDATKSLIHALDNGLIWSRYPQSALYRQNAIKADAQLWLNYSLEILEGQPVSLNKINELLKFAARMHCEVLAYVAEAAKMKISKDIFENAQSAIIEAWKVESIAATTPKPINPQVSLLQKKIDHVLKCSLDTAQKTGVVHSALRDVQSHLLRLAMTAAAGKSNVWTKRNLKNIQWVFEQLYVCRYYLRSNQIEHIHDFTMFQKLLGDNQGNMERICGFNFGTAIHYPYLYEKVDQRAKEFCAELEQEQANFVWKDKEEPLSKEMLAKLDEGFDLVNSLLDTLIAEGNLGKAFVIIK